MKDKKYTFVLKLYDLNEIDKKYNLVQIKQFSNIDIPEYTTKIDDLEINEEKYYSISSDTRYYITMYDSISNRQLQKCNCFWDRHQFDTLPIGCPIKYIPNKIYTEYQVPTKDKYTITQNIPLIMSDCVTNIDDKTIIKNDYYLVDGCFCSFNCCLAFIEDNINNPLYSNSKYLLMRIFVETFKEFNLDLELLPSPHWRLLKAYGGTMTIDTFRKSVNNYTYIEHNYAANIPKMLSVGNIYEEVKMN